MDIYVYVDESGDLGRGIRSSNYFVIASIETEYPRRLEKVAKNVWRSKPQLHYAHELHAYEADDSTRRKFLQKIAELDIRIRLSIVHKPTQSGALLSKYYILLAEHIGYFKAAKVIIIDKKDTAAKRQSLLRTLHLTGIFEHVEFADSRDVKQLQAVDFVAWAVLNKYEQNNPEFYDLISTKITREDIRI